MIIILNSTSRNGEDTIHVIEAVQTKSSIRVSKPDPVLRKVLQELPDIGGLAA